jgi:hypothetical protein
VQYTGTWGSALLAGAVHQLRSAVVSGLAPLGFDDIPDTDYGFAVTAQGSVNLPMLAPGDALWIAATYADGAMGYLGFDSTNTVGRSTTDIVDAYIGSDGETKTGRGWSVAGGLRHYWTPEVRQSVFGSYARVEYGSVPALAAPGVVAPRRRGPVRQPGSARRRSPQWRFLGRSHPRSARLLIGSSDLKEKPRWKHRGFSFAQWLLSFRVFAYVWLRQLASRAIDSRFCGATLSRPTSGEANA